MSPVHACRHRKFLKCLNSFGGDGIYCILSDSSATLAGQKSLCTFDKFIYIRLKLTDILVLHQGQGLQFWLEDTEVMQLDGNSSAFSAPLCI